MASCSQSMHNHKEESEEFRTDGEIYFLRSFPAEHFSGEQYSVHILENITGRKQAEVKLLATQAELQGLLDVAKQSRKIMLGMIEDQRQTEAAVRRLNEELESKVLARTVALDYARLEAEQANRAKSEFLAAMSHEIRTPMNGVIGMIDVLEQSSLNSSQMESANIIHDSAYSLLAIINDILDFSKIEAGKLQIDSLPMSVAEVVDVVCETIDHMALKKNVELTLFTDPAIPAAVIGDAGRLRQILVNLANKAPKIFPRQKKAGRRRGGGGVGEKKTCRVVGGNKQTYPIL